MATATSDDDFARALRDLTDIQAELERVDPADFSRRQRLRDQESALREDIRSFSEAWTDHLSIDQLQRRIAQVEQRLEDHYGNRLSHTSGGQSGFGGGLDPKYLHQMHRAMDKSADLDAMKAELVRLKGRLTKLQGD